MIESKALADKIAGILDKKGATDIQILEVGHLTSITDFFVVASGRNVQSVHTLAEDLEEHLAEDLDVDALAEKFYVSKYHMMRQFRQETGFTVHAYLQQRRLLHARDLIEKGMRATEACYRSGFRSYSSFTRACAALFGTTPTGRTAAAEREESYE